MAKATLIPELRFPEFNKEWEQRKLGSLVNFKSGGTPPKDIHEYWNGDIPWISAASMLGKYYNKSERTITELGLNKGSKISPSGSILLLVRGSMLYNKVPVGIAEIDVAFNQDLKSLLPSKEIDVHFLYEWFMHSQHNLLNLVVGTGIGAGKIDTDDLKRLSVFTPSFPEQQKIASFLSAVDQRLQLLQSKKEKLEAYKKGVMQQTFSQEIRFKIEDKNGKLVEAPDWEEKRLGEIGEIITGKTPKTTAKELWNGDIDFITPTDINENKKYQLSVSRTVCETNKMTILPINTIVYTCIASIGKMSLTTKPSVTNQQINSLIVNDTSLNEFVFYALKWLTPKIKATQANTTLPIINKTEFSKFKIPIPDIKEQQKIAAFLSGIDRQIAIVEKQLNQSKQFKQGLLQKMFV